MLISGGSTLPGPRLPRPVAGVRFLATEHRMLARYRRRYGDIFAVKVWPFDPLVVVGDPAEVKRIFRGDPAQLHAGEGNQVLGPVVGPRSVLVLDEQEHLRTRKMLLPPFHGARMRVYGDVMREEAEAEMATWPLGTEFPLLGAMQRLTLRIILRTVFGVEQGTRMAELERALIRLMGRGAQIMLVPLLQRDYGPGSPQRRFEEARLEVDELLFAEIARRRREPDGTDVLSMLLQADEPPTDAELRDHLITLLLAGHETTATTLAWTFERLVRHPEALARASTGDEAYIDAVVQESQRLRPVITYVMRTLQAPMTVGGHEVPAGATLGTSITLMHRRADLYPQPLAFRPERFLEAKPETYTWVPFGGGVRRCLGASFASFEMRQVLDVVLSSRRLTAADPRPERYRRRGITFVPGRGAAVVAQAVPA
ncbi:MAG TPA: cytochrome P450 [Solirubrobacteraceae bacterium]|nr:cytochrome P450 [Solirubrobacteraceae bacterium]